MHPKPHEFSNLILLIQEDRDLGWILFQKFIDRFPTFFRVYAKYDQPFGLIPAVQPFQRRSLLPAIRSPGSPEVEQKDFSSIILDLDHLPGKVFQGKIGKGQRFRIGLKDICPLAPGQVNASNPQGNGQGQSHQTDNRPSLLSDFHIPHLLPSPEFSSLQLCHRKP